MRIRKTDPITGEPSMGQGQSDYWRDQPEAVAESIRSRLALGVGQWFLDTTEGTRFDLIFGRSSAATRNHVLQRRILATGGVTELVAYAARLDGRALTVTAEVGTAFGRAVVTSTQGA